MSISVDIRIIVLFFFNFILFSIAQFEECEVCTDVLTETMKSVESSGETINQELVRQNIIDYCTDVVGKNDKKEKLCFFIGAHKDSATSILGDVSKPLAYRKPPAKICQELKEKDVQICALKYGQTLKLYLCKISTISDKPIDWDSLELEKMRVKQLKELLAKLGDSCKGCVEKSDYVKRIEELKPKPKTEL